MKLARITMVLFASLALTAAACGKDKDKGKEGEGTAKPTEEPPEKPPEPQPMTADQFVQKIKDCWAAVDAKDEAKFAACYAETSVHEHADFVPEMKATGPQEVIAAVKPFWAGMPDLTHPLESILVNGENAVVVFVAQGTNSGQLMGQEPTGKKISIRGAQYIEFTPTGEVVRDTVYFDQGSMAGQLGMSEAPHAPPVEEVASETTVVVAADDETEQANLEVAKADLEAFNAHDVEKAMANYADDAVFNYVSSPDGPVEGKDAIAKKLEEYYKMSSDVKTEVVNMWAAGDYVVAEALSKGTHDGDMGKMKATNKPFEVRELSVTRYEDGKIKEFWIFSNSMAWASQLGMLDQGEGDKPAGKKPAQ